MGDVLKSCKRTDRAGLRLSSIRKAGRNATPAPGVQRLADTVDEFELDCKSDHVSRRVLCCWLVLPLRPRT